MRTPNYSRSMLIHRRSLGVLSQQRENPWEQTTAWEDEVGLLCYLVTVSVREWHMKINFLFQVQGCRMLLQVYAFIVLSWDAVCLLIQVYLAFLEAMWHLVCPPKQKSVKNDIVLVSHLCSSDISYSP